MATEAYAQTLTPAREDATRSSISVELVWAVVGNAHVVKQLFGGRRPVTNPGRHTVVVQKARGAAVSPNISERLPTLQNGRLSWLRHRRWATLNYFTWF